MLQKCSVLNKCSSFELSMHQIIQKNKILGSTTVFNIDNNQKRFLSSNKLDYNCICSSTAEISSKAAPVLQPLGI